MQWMYWTPITAAFFGAVALMLICMVTAQVFYPTKERKGFLPINTTRGDRMFIGLLSGAYIHLAWIGLLADRPLWWATVVCLVWVGILLRWG